MRVRHPVSAADPPRCNRRSQTAFMRRRQGGIAFPLPGRRRRNVPGPFRRVRSLSGTGRFHALISLRQPARTPIWQHGRRSSARTAAAVTLRLDARRAGDRGGKGLSEGTARSERTPAQTAEPAEQPRVATIRDVAAAAGVSVGTASKALNGRGKLRAETRARVAGAAEQLGFRPNTLARGLLA